MGKSLTLDGRYFRSNKVGHDYKSNVPTYYMPNKVGRDGAELYDETIDSNQQQTPPSRLGSLAGTVGNAIGQTILEDAVPYIDSPNILAQLFNMYKTAGYKVFRARKHDCGQEAFENNIPIAKEFIQNLWSLANLGRGLVRIESLYTVKKVGTKDEKPIYLEFWGDGDPLTLNELKGLGKYALQDDRQALEINARYVRGKIKDPSVENEETTLSGAYSEITDRDLERKGIIDPTAFKSDFMPGDLFLTGQKGKRSVVYSSAAEGMEIVKYDKAGFMDHLTYRGKQDGIFTMIGFLYKLIDITDFHPIAKQSIVQDQGLQSIKATNRLYDKKRSDGVDNPVVGMT